MPAGFILDVIVGQGGSWHYQQTTKASYMALWLRSGVESSESSVPVLPVALMHYPSLGDLLNSTMQEE